MKLSSKEFYGYSACDQETNYFACSKHLYLGWTYHGKRFLRAVCRDIKLYSIDTLLVGN